MKVRVYIAGPISNGDLLANIRQADEAFGQLLRAGYAPLCPHWSCFYGSSRTGYDERTVVAVGNPLPGGTTHDDWVSVDLAWVAASDVVLRLPGESKGADLEVATATRLDIPVVRRIEDIPDVLPAGPTVRGVPSAGHPGYLQLLRDMEELHCRKAADYGTEADPLANIRASSDVGIEPWRAAYMRAKDKVKRIDAYCRKGKLANEGVEDSMLDLAAYALITLLLHREAKGE